MESTRRQQHVIAPCPAGAGAAIYRLRTLGELRLEGPEGEIRDLRRKERVLLAYLARATGPRRRAELAALLWGAQPEPRARHSLRQALCALRKALPGAFCVGREAVCLIRGVLDLDVAGLELDLRQGRPAAAAERWDGEFLAGLEDSGDEPLRAWIEAERAGVRRLVSEALEAAATSPDPASRESALHPVQRWAEAHPYDEAAQRRLVRLLLSLDRPAEAAAWRARAAERLAEDLGVPAVAASARLGFAGDAGHASQSTEGPATHIAASEVLRAGAALVPAWLRVRDGGSEVATLAVGDAADRRALCDDLCRLVCVTDDGATPAVVLRASARPGGGSWSVARRLLVPIRWARGLSAASDAALADVAVLVPALRSRYPHLPAPAGCEARLRRGLQEVLAEIAAEAPVLLVVEDAGSADVETRRWLAELAVTPVPGVMLVLAGDPAVLAADGELAALARAGAPTDSGEGALRPPAGGPSRRPAAVGPASASSPDAPPDPAQPPAALSHAAPGRAHPPAPPRTRPRWPSQSSRLRIAAITVVVVLVPGILAAMVLGMPRSAPGTGGTAATPAARALYDAGLRALYDERDDPAALRFFSAALRRDSTFAMAAYYAGVTSGAVTGQQELVRLLRRAEALSAGATERDRMFILAGSALLLNDPAAGLHAEALARLYPADPAGRLLLGSSLVQQGRFDDAVRQLEHAVAMSPPSGTGRCHRCEAYSQLAETYWMADSAEAAVRTVRAWAALRPDEPVPQTRLAGYLLATGRYGEAAAARRRAAELGSADVDDILFDAVHGIRSADFAAADPGLDYLGRAATSAISHRAVWLQVISFRNQRRQPDAWAAATRYRELLQPGRPATHPWATPQAVVLLESGQPLRAAAMFDTMFHRIGDLGRPSRTARDQAWLLTLRATALAAAGDTARLAVLADSIHALGLRSGYGRDRRLHHHVRGVLLRARGDAPAAERELRSAIYSTTAGYTRTSIELAGTLLDQQRAAEAIPPLQAALRAPLDGPAYYVTRTELYELLARAFDGAGVPDSAAAYERLVAASIGDRTEAVRGPRPRQLVASRR